MKSDSDESVLDPSPLCHVLLRLVNRSFGTIS
jgi:hypothetical protein